ncbi:hypothetical protein AVEN_36777-1 [Araneus ventricosus]|uniref:Uncharacterized protein n=1 Tax=Araneus ventricosus TaxID=182803 RepID=A0A4Y2KM88_ARAVE|nr:hypothetical protein AVEN_36777-1 [Araneus ventricosus]
MYVKLDIHALTIPRHLERIDPHRTSFKPIHLSGTFTMVPCKRHHRSLQCPRATVLTPPPAFKKRPPAPLSRKSFTPPPPFSGFRFCERRSLPFPTNGHISILSSAPNGKRGQMKIQTFRPYRINSHRILELTTGFGATRSK